MLSVYDQATGHFVLKGKKSQFWPDGTPKSTDNDFNWRPAQPNSNATTPQKKHRTNKERKWTTLSFPTS